MKCKSNVIPDTLTMHLLILFFLKQYLVYSWLKQKRNNKGSVENEAAHGGYHFRREKAKIQKHTKQWLMPLVSK